MQTFIRWRRSEAPHAPILKIDQMADARRSLEELKSVAAQSEGRLLLLLDVKTAETLAEIEDPALHFLRFIGKDTTSSHWRYLYRLDVPPDSDPTPIPPCAR